MTLPGLTLTVVPPPAEPDVLRTDVAVFLGRATRGPVGVPLRLSSWNDVLASYGPPDGLAATPFALRGFFDNGGRTAWLVRVAGAGQAATALWTVGSFADGAWGPGAPARGGFAYAKYLVVATSPGAWANNTRVSIRFRASSVAGPPTVSVRVSAPGEPVESFPDLPPAEVADRLAASRLIRLIPDGPPVPSSVTAPTGPLTIEWDLVLGAPPQTPAEAVAHLRGADEPPTGDDYRSAIETMADLAEPALVAAPDLDVDLGGEAWADTVLALLGAIAPLHDRLAVIDLPAGPSADEALGWVGQLTGTGDDMLLRAAAVYHPRLMVPDPSGGVGDPLRAVPSAGHVSGLIARLDAERGAHHTPANAVLLDAVDLAAHLPEAQQVRLFDAGVNLLRCAPGQGLRVWGGRTLSPLAASRFVAHRRLVHLLVRAVRRVADPLVFDVNGPELRLTLVRGVTSVLLEAFRSGALAGSRPEQAFRVKCDDENNPPAQDPGLVICDIEVAPANPMEFIELRLILGQDRGLEVIEQ
jgi:hypothetical protein